MKMIKFPKIKQFRQVVSDIIHAATFTGLDSDDKPIYNSGAKKPIVNFTGTVKLHGTNASVCYNKKDGLWTQSREQIITPDNDNAGFSGFAYGIKKLLIEKIERLAQENEIDLSVLTICVYGEWAGSGVQKGVGISQIEKAFFVFGTKVSNTNDDDFDSYWIDFRDFKIEDKRVFNILDYPTFSVDVDFSMPQLSQNKFTEITNDVEKECPVAKAFGVSGTGEGVVWIANYKNKNHRFKVKGQKHSVTKVKKLAEVDVEKLNSIKAFVEYAVTENRVEQGVSVVFGSSENIDRKKMGDFLRWIIKDITEEESDTLEKNNLSPKDVNKYISFQAREMFFKLEATF